VSAIFQFVLKHGYSIFFAVLFAHQIGFPLPGPPFLLAAGALAAAGKFDVLTAISLAITACVLADWVWYEAGRRKGDKVLHFMHGLTRDPDAHDRRAKKIFARYGLSLLLVAKFVPGLDAVAPPLAGTSRISRVRFLVVDAAGAGLYTCVYGGLGYLFSNDLDRAAVYVSRMGTLLAGLAFGGFCVYIAYKLVQRYRAVRESRTKRIAPADPIEYGDSVDMSCEIIAGEDGGEQRDSKKTGIAESCEAWGDRRSGAVEEDLVPMEKPAQQKGDAMKLAKQLMFLPTLLFMIACAYGQNIHYNYDRGTNFAEYKTYQWVDIPGGRAPDQLVDQAIKRAIDEQLMKKGLTKVEQDADLSVAYVAVIHEGKNVDSAGLGGPRWWDPVLAQGQIPNTPIGTVTVILYDPERDQLIWRGDASKTIDLKKDPDKNYKNLQKAMAKLFENYPPGHKK